MMHIINRIIGLRTQKKLKQKHIYSALGMDASQYSKIERGEVGITVQQLAEISKILETSLDFLVFGMENYSNKSDLNLVAEEPVDYQKEEISRLIEDRKEWLKTKRNMQQLIDKLNDEISEIRKKNKDIKDPLGSSRKK